MLKLFWVDKIFENKYFLLTKAAFIWSKNTVKTVILWNIITNENNCFLFEYVLKM